MIWTAEGNEEKAYSELYLTDILKRNRFLFTKIAECEEYDTVSMIEAYLKHSEIRKRADKGNWSALNKSTKQLYNSIDVTRCKRREKDDRYDDILLSWVSDMYVLMQWYTKLPSAKICEWIPPQEMFRAYNPLHETSRKNACEKLYHKYIEQIEEQNKEEIEL